MARQSSDTREISNRVCKNWPDRVKGRTTIDYVRDYSNYEFLPAQLPSMTAKSGTEIAFTGDPTFAIFWKELKNHLKYECYFNEKVQRPVFTQKQERGR